ncbi:MAG: FadR/GntR family transcriptional regulator [Myxococcota bacterium]|nr:hypothetical protein [Deltaproteobacteria bacterium]
MPPPDSQSDRIARDLRSDILNGRYQPGDRLPSERALAERFEVQRGAVREGLKKVEQLGLASIQPGGVRVCPLEKASLDIVGHLMALSSPPDPEIVGMVFEVSASLGILAARLATERGTDEQIDHCLELLSELAAPNLGASEEYEIMTRLIDTLVEASQNLVLELAHRALRTQFITQIEGHAELLSASNEMRISGVSAVKKALKDRDGPAVAELLNDLSTQVRTKAILILHNQIKEKQETKRAGEAS